MMGSNPYRNPFPHLGAMSLESRKIDFESDVLTTELPTLELGPVAQVLKLIRRYIRDYSTDRENRGVATILRGDHGTGKTHTINYAIHRLKGYKASAPREVEKPIHIYAKADDPDFLKVYQTLMDQVSFESF